MVCKQEQISAIIVAGGQGTRFKSQIPKQFVLLNGLPLLFQTLAAFVNHPQVSKIVVVLPKADPALVEKLCAYFPDQAITGVVGGETRQASVLCGLNAISGVKKVLIHDGVRPLVTIELIDRCLTVLNDHLAGCPVIPVTDTIVCAHEKQVQGYINRSNHFRVQTPQGFDFSTIRTYHQRAEAEGLLFTDDCSLLHHYGLPITRFEGDPQNLKISTPVDFLIIKSILSSKTRS